MGYLRSFSESRSAQKLASRAISGTCENRPFLSDGCRLPGRLLGTSENSLNVNEFNEVYVRLGSIASKSDRGELSDRPDGSIRNTGQSL